MVPQAPWSPNAHAFAHHQFSHVTNFWRQGRPASFRLEALPGGRAELNLTFQLPPASEVVPPPSHVSQVLAPQSPVHPLFPNGCFPQGSHLHHRSGSGPNQPKPKPASTKVSSRQRKSYRRSVLHKAGLATSSLPPPKYGSLRHAASASVQRLQADQAKSERKRPLPDSPSVQSPMAQRIREDFQISENEVESPEKELLRSQTFPEKSPAPSPFYVKNFPSPAPLVFTPPKTPESPNCLNCDVKMTPDHQCKSGDESEIIGMYEVDEKESVEIAKVVDKDKTVEDEQVIESVKVGQVESAKIEQGLESVIKPTEVEQVIESAKVEQAVLPPPYLCYNCGLEGHFARECPFERPKYTCYNCGGEGHFARDCDK